MFTLINTYARTRWTMWATPVFIIALAALLVQLGPDEATLGSGIKSVYVHVSLIWTGMTGFLLTAGLGVVVAVTGREKLESWTFVTGWVALGFFVAGFAMSMVAASINWGAFFWAEPRAQSALGMMAVSLIVLIVISWLDSVRGRGILYVIPAVWLSLSILVAPLVLHPDNPIQSSSSRSIQLTFLGMFALCSLGATWLVWAIRRYRQAQVEPGRG